MAAEPEHHKEPKARKGEYHRLFYENGKPKPEEFQLLAELIASGYTDEIIAKYYGVSRKSIGVWKREHSEFFAVFKANTTLADSRVEASLFERAVGYEHVETKVVVVKGRIKLVDVIKVYPPDVSAGLNWLYNRRPDKWRKEVHNINENKDMPTYDYGKLSEEQQDKLEELLKLASPDK